MRIDPPHFTSLDTQIKLKTISATVLTSTFYVLQLASQAILKTFRLHGGLSPLITLPIGFAVTANNLLVSQCVESEVCRVSNNYGMSGKIPSRLPSHESVLTNLKRNYSNKDQIRRLVIGLGIFMILEQGLFRTAFPSSVIMPGVFSNAHNSFHRSVLATSEVATEAQRFKIQKLGRVFGCHHCGSRQLFSRKSFIADHMPPTKMAKALEKKWWRRLLNLKVQQRLWPQCMNCYGLQGQAVRIGKHVLISHFAWKSQYLAPALAMLLCSDKEVQQMIDGGFRQVRKVVDSLLP